MMINIKEKFNIF